MGTHEFPEAGIDFDRANAARMYDYMLGGAHNFAVDREQAAAVMAAHPDAVRVLTENRAFLGRAVRWCVDAGIDQFLDLGSGVPTVGNVHEVAHQHNPAARVAYVDFEPVAVAHADEIIAGLGTVTVTAADVRDTRRVLTAPGVAGLLDFTRPIALLAVAVLHFIPDGVTELLDAYRRALVPGSAVVLSHSSDDHDAPDFAAHMRAAAEAYRDSATPGTLRSRAQLHQMLAGLKLAGPGLVDVINWPDNHHRRSGFYGAVGLIP